jgi:hypothetical protein
MSTKYKKSSDVPLDVLLKRLDELADAARNGRETQDREFTIRIPAECDRDADLVISQAVIIIRELQAKVSELEAGQQSVSVPESWRSTMKELSDDLESEIESRRSRKIDPRIERDLIVVKEARALLAAQEQD